MATNKVGRTTVVWAVGGVIVAAILSGVYAYASDQGRQAFLDYLKWLGAAFAAIAAVIDIVRRQLRDDGRAPTPVRPTSPATPTPSSGAGGAGPGGPGPGGGAGSAAMRLRPGRLAAERRRLSSESPTQRMERYVRHRAVLLVALAIAAAHLFAGGLTALVSWWFTLEPSQTRVAVVQLVLSLVFVSLAPLWPTVNVFNRVDRTPSLFAIVGIAFLGAMTAGALGLFQINWGTVVSLSKQQSKIMSGATVYQFLALQRFAFVPLVAVIASVLWYGIVQRKFEKSSGEE